MNQSNDLPACRTMSSAAAGHATRACDGQVMLRSRNEQEINAEGYLESIQMTGPATKNNVRVSVTCDPSGQTCHVPV